MSDIAELYAEHKKDVRENKQEQLARRTAQLLELRDEGFDIKALTQFQYRVNGRLDIYPVWGKWHDIKHNKRGKFTGISTKEFVRRFFHDSP